MDLVGRTLGKYSVTGRLGSGGMGVVYRARHPGLEIDVALKVLSPATAANPAALARFRREATLLARLNHTGIVPVQDSDTYEGIAYFVMPLVQHPTLEREVDDLDSRGEPYPLPRAVSVVRSLLDVLAAVHAEGVIHRDLKPANLFVRPDASALLADFGLARTEQDSHLTRSGTAVGTTPWMAPEQLDALPCDNRTDLYQAGLILYYLANGSLPFSNELSDVVRAKCLTGQLPPPVRAGLPAGLVDVVMRLTARDPAARFTTAAEAIAALDSAGEVAAPSRVASASATGALYPTSRRRDATAPVTAPVGEAGSARHAWPWRVSTGVLALALVLSVRGLAKREQRTAPAPSSSVAATAEPSGVVARPRAASPSPSDGAWSSPAVPPPFAPGGERPRWGRRILEALRDRQRERLSRPGAGIEGLNRLWPRRPPSPREKLLRNVLELEQPASSDGVAIAAVSKLSTALDLSAAAWSPEASTQQGVSRLLAELTTTPTAESAWFIAGRLREIDSSAARGAQHVLEVRAHGEPANSPAVVRTQTSALLTMLSLLYDRFHQDVVRAFDDELRAARGRGENVPMEKIAERLDARIEKWLHARPTTSPPSPVAPAALAGPGR